ncbi:MAG: (d)CMP kinase [Deltaproteobacteria bacterium]|nr:(d)CMP kinase [Deltaproteobacteria bacterium]
MTFIIAIDGPAGAGKSTVATLVASALGLVRIDTGALYRAAALHAVRVGATEESEIGAALGAAKFELIGDKVLINGEEVSRLIRTPEISRRSSEVSALKRVRQALLAIQRGAAMSQPNGAVLEGRDIGTVVFPDAELKIFLTASPVERARRRTLELAEKGTPVPAEDVLRDILARDERDQRRENAPLVRAEDAVLIDTTGRSLDSIVQEITSIARGRRAPAVAEPDSSGHI